MRKLLKAMKDMVKQEADWLNHSVVGFGEKDLSWLCGHQIRHAHLGRERRRCI